MLLITDTPRIFLSLSPPQSPPNRPSSKNILHCLSSRLIHYLTLCSLTCMKIHLIIQINFSSVGNVTQKIATNLTIHFVSVVCCRWPLVWKFCIWLRQQVRYVWNYFDFFNLEKYIFHYNHETNWWQIERNSTQLSSLEVTAKQR